MSEYTEAAAALIKVRAEDLHKAEQAYYGVEETAAAERAHHIAEALDRAAVLLREDAEPSYDDVKNKASELANRIYWYLEEDSSLNRYAMTKALEEYEEAVENEG